MAVCTIQNPIFELLHKRTSAKEKGVYSCCSANAFVIRAALRRAKANDTVVLVEATANQVNQNGGYTGMTPADSWIAWQRKKVCPPTASCAAATIWGR